jgi:hypothetical protein
MELNGRNFKLADLEDLYLAKYRVLKVKYGT